MFRHLSFILKNSWRNRRRTTLTILSIGVSLCLLGVLMAIYHAFYFNDPTPDEALRLVTRNRVSLAFPMPEFYRDKVRKLPGVREVAVEDWYGGTYIDSKPEHMFARFATEPDKIFTIRGEAKVPPDQLAAFVQDRRGCAVGRELADKYNLHLGEKLTLQGDIYPGNLELTIRAIYDSPDNRDILYFNRKYIEEGLPERRKGNAGVLFILANSTGDVPVIEKAVDEMFQNSPVQTKTESESAFSLSFVAFLGNIKAFLLIVCAAVTFTILLVSANTIAMSVRERVREVGVLKVLGFTRGTILGIILGEAVAVSLIGAAVGVLLATGLAYMLHFAPVPMEQLKTLSIGPSVAAICLGVGGLIGLVSAFLPAFQASIISILDALRSTD